MEIDKNLDRRENLFKTKPHIFIAEETDAVISFVKKQDCILNSIIEPFPDILELEKFATYHYWSSCESVNVFQVIGTAHPDYAGYSWIDMLKIGKRMLLNLRLLKENPGYYFETSRKKPDMHYTRVNERLYISGEGNHRTSIAKVLFYFTGDQVLHGIVYDEYAIDFEARELLKAAKKTLLSEGYPVDVEVRRKNVRREDTAGWKRDYYELFFVVKNYRYHRERIIKKAELRKLIEEATRKRNFITRLFSTGKGPFSDVLRK